MSSLGFEEYVSSTVRCDVPELQHEWFWPRLTYQQAEWLLGQKVENMVLIRMSESDPGNFALTAGQNILG